MQTLWNFPGFNGIGFSPDHLHPYLNGLAQWQKTGDVHFCDPLVPLERESQHDPSNRLKGYFADSNGKPYDSLGYTTNMLSEAAGYRLRWSLGPYFLKIVGDAWNRPAPLPNTNPNDFLFWFCCSYWRGGGGDLQLSPRESEVPVEIAYRQGTQAAMSYNMPHVLTAVVPPPYDPRRASARIEPYYCLYGQLQEIKGEQEN